MIAVTIFSRRLRRENGRVSEESLFGTLRGALVGAASERKTIDLIGSALAGVAKAETGVRGGARVPRARIDHWSRFSPALSVAAPQDRSSENCSISGRRK